MSAEIVIYLLALASGAFLTLSLQAHRKALKAVKEAHEAVASVDALSDTVRYQVKVINEQTKAHLDVFTSDYDKRLQKLEMRVDDQGSRVAALQIKR
jgi:hypothetical protein